MKNGKYKDAKKKTNYPDYVIKRKMLKNENKIVVLAARNNLRYEDFTYKDGCYIKREDFKVGSQLYGKTEIIINSDNFDEIYSIKSKSVKIQKTDKGFNILIYTKDKIDLPISVVAQAGCLYCHIVCKGTGLSLTGVPKKSAHKITHLRMKQTGPVAEINKKYPNSVVFSYMHPFGGGAMK